MSMNVKTKNVLNFCLMSKKYHKYTPKTFKEKVFKMTFLRWVQKIFSEHIFEMYMYISKLIKNEILNR